MSQAANGHPAGGPRRKKAPKAALVIRREAIEKHLVVRVQLAAPRGVSKSLARAMGCPTYFTGQYLQSRDSRVEVEHPLGRTGKQFHDYRKDYANHLVAERKPMDPAFAEQWLGENPAGEDARTLIFRDAARWSLQWQDVYGAELFLSLDRSFAPLEHEFDRPPGSLSSHPDFLVSGQIDLLLIHGDTAEIIDPKSGFSTTGVTDDEPPIYAGLVMAHFPAVNEVRFQWDFVRREAGKRATYTRADLGWIESRIREIDRQKDDLVEAYNRGEAMGANPFSGLCPYCSLACPLRPRAEDGEVAFPPPQTRLDAVRIAQFLHVCESGADQARKLLRGWLDQDLFGQLDVGGDYVAELSVDLKRQVPLIDGLLALGLDVVDRASLPDGVRELVAVHRPRYTPYYDVPLEALAVSGVSSFTKSAKSRKRPDGGGVSREGMKEGLDAIAKRTPSTRVVIKRVTEADALARLKERTDD